MVHVANDSPVVPLMRRPSKYTQAQNNNRNRLQYLVINVCRVSLPNRLMKRISELHVGNFQTERARPAFFRSDVYNTSIPYNL